MKPYTASSEIEQMTFFNRDHFVHFDYGLKFVC